MAGIDKTYTNSYKDYIDLINWARKYTFTCPNGTIVDISKSIYNWTEEDFIKATDEGYSLPIMNTSSSTDYFLIKCCPLQFVQDRMKDVYDDEYDEIKNNISPYDTFSKEGKYGTHCKLISSPKKPFRNNRPLNIKQWWVDIILPESFDGYLWYLVSYNKWVWPYELHGNTTDISSGGWFEKRFKTRKAIERHICKWKLPKGTIVQVCGKYINEEYKYLVY